MSSFDNITDILLDGNFDTLYSFLSSSLDSNDYVTAKTYATYCELSINNQDYVIIQQFYAYQMMLCIIFDDCLGARMLWKRLPVQLKASLPPTDVALLYEVILSIKDNKINDAYKILKETPWQPYIINHMVNARKLVQKRAFITVSKAFSTILVSTLCELVDMSNDEVMQQIKSYDWQFDETTNSITITSAISDSDYQDQIVDDTKMIIKLSEYIGLFEKKPIKVDISLSK